jgi:hypothetical protein
MQVQFHVLGTNANAGCRRHFEQTLKRLESDIAIGAAVVVLEHGIEGTLPFRAYVSLAVPGPDIHAEARAHSLQDAWLKVIEDLRKQIGARQTRKARPNSRRQVPFSTNRWAGGLSASRTWASNSAGKKFKDNRLSYEETQTQEQPQQRAATRSRRIYLANRRSRLHRRQF